VKEKEKGNEKGKERKRWERKERGKSTFSQITAEMSRAASLYKDEPTSFGMVTCCVWEDAGCCPGPGCWGNSCCWGGGLVCDGIS